MMTTKKDQKKLIRERKATTGESYTTARKHVLAKRPAEPAPLEEETPPGESSTEPPGEPPDLPRYCPKCNGELIVETHQELPELDDNASESEYAEYTAAELSEEYGDFGVEEVEVRCPNCGYQSTESSL